MIALSRGWAVHHLTDRVVELRKDCYAYRALTGRDGYVLVRVEPEMTREQAIERAERLAAENDRRLMERVAAQLIPSGPALGRFRREQQRLARPFGVPGQEPTERVYRP